MSREAQTPLILWICAGIVFHMVCKDGAEEVAQVVEDRANIRALVQSVREGLRPEDTTFEILIEAPPTPSEEKAEAPAKEAPDEAKPEDEAEEPKDAPKPKPEKLAEKKPVEPPKGEEKKAEAPPPLPPEEKKVAEEKKVEEQKPAEPLPPPPAPDHRIAIRQHVEPNQKDNPNASRIADQANTVQEETVAKLRSHDQDDPDPNAGAIKKPSPTGDTGNNDHDKIAQSEEKAGTDNAPGESKDHSTSAEHHHAAPPAPEKVARAASAPAAIPGGKAGSGGNPAPPAQASPPPSPGGAGPSSPEVVASEGGSFSLDPANPGGDGKSKHAGRRRQPAPYQAPVKVGSVGLGAPGQPGGPNLNLSMAGVEASVGLEKLKAERAADGAARRSAHRGKWDKNNFGRYRAAIENYEPSVKVGNQTALNAAQVPFATYLNTVHNRLHPIFAEEFLASLENLPGEHSLNKQLVTHLEIVLSKDEGKIVRMGVTRASGVTAFDIVALNAFQRASPYGKAPEAIVSGDGNVYLHWEFHRDPFDACTTRNAFPYLLPSKGGAAAPVAPPRQAPSLSPTDERRTPPPLLPLRTP